MAVLDKTRPSVGFRLLPILFGIVIATCTLALPAPRASTPSGAESDYFRLRLRTRVEAYKGSEVWREAYFQQTFSTHKTAILICDMWNKHWCAFTTRRINVLAEKMEPVLERARAAGVQIIHSPSNTMSFYKIYPQRLVMMQLTLVQPPPSLGLTDPPSPIDSSDGGCPTPGDYEHKVWTRENPKIQIAKQDVISDSGKQIYSFIRQHDIKTIFYMGEAVNMCVLDRTFGIKAMTNWGIHCVLLRDLTDSMYNPKDPPYESHDKGTELEIEHIERFWCPSALSTNLMQSLTNIGPNARGR